MDGDLEKRILNAYETAMLTHYSKNEFCINEYAEESLCLVKRDEQWVTFAFERGYMHHERVYDSLLEACISNFRHTELSASKELEESFARELLLEKEDISWLQKSYLEALEIVVSKRYPQKMYNIGGYQEAAICLQFDVNGWAVYNAERGNRYAEIKCDTVLEACLEFIRKFTHRAEDIASMENELITILGTKVD